MNKFDRKQLVDFVQSLDRHLSEPVSLFIIGGAAASLGYDSNTKTSDIDVYKVNSGSIEAIRLAGLAAYEETGIDVSIGSGSVAELPHNYEDRISELIGLRLKNLTLTVPDKYDLALSKVVRGYPHDIEAIEGIDKHHRLAESTLIERFETELVGQAVVDRRKLRLNFIILIAALYGHEEGKRLATEWGFPIPTR